MAKKLQVISALTNPRVASAYLVSDQFNRATAWAPVREIGEALGCVVSAGQLLDDAKTQAVTIGPAPNQMIERGAI